MDKDVLSRLGFLDVVNNGVLVLERDTTIRFWNSWLSAHTGRQSADIVQKKLIDIYPEINGNLLKRKITSTLQMNVPSFYNAVTNTYLFPIPISKFTKSRYQFIQQDVVITPFDREAGQVLVMIYDQTPLIESQQTIAQRNQELELLTRELESRVRSELSKNRQKDYIMIQQSRMAALGEMIGNIAHQWRQPLTSLSLVVQDMMDAYDYNEFDREYLKQQVDESMRLIEFMSSTIDDFRNFFQPERESRKFSLVHTTKRTISIVRSSLVRYNITLNLHYDEEIIIDGFQNEYTQALINIVNNAKDELIKNHITNGVITIRISRVGNRCRIEVEDNAGGIPEHIFHKVFDPYFTTKSRGTGLGLYIAKMVIEKHCNGVLAVSNREGGACFTIELDAVPLSAESVAE